MVIGHNDRIAWGFTNNGADVQDLYIETFNPAQPEEYKVNGKWVKAQVVDEVIHVKNALDGHIWITDEHSDGHHPARPGHEAETATLATRCGGRRRNRAGLANTYNRLGKAQNWKEFREIMKTVWGPAQNVVYADVQGKYRVCDGGASADSKEGTRRGAGSRRYGFVRMEGLHSV